MDEAASTLNLSRRSVERYVRAGSLPAVKFAGRVLVEAEDVRRFAAGTPVVQPHTKGSDPGCLICSQK